MAGAVIIEPREGLPEVDREYVVVQSEVYLLPGTGQGGEAPAEVDADAVLAERPAFVETTALGAAYLAGLAGVIGGAVHLRAGWASRWDGGPVSRRATTAPTIAGNQSALIKPIRGLSHET